MGHQFPCFRHKFTRAEVRKESHHSQQMEALTPSPVASGSSSCWKQDNNPTGPNPAVIKNRRPFTPEYCAYCSVFLPCETKPMRLALMIFILGCAGSSSESWSHRKCVVQPELRTQQPYPVIGRRAKTSLSHTHKKRF